jgi:glyoxylase-like metal-dependent hydrolase (beta-lactamase superfamily II)/rhodanese-related sulfurtransferase
MFFKQYYLGCLAQASYLIGDGAEAVVVDPRRDVEEYVEDARANGFAIRHVIETHLHADFVSGHRELAARTGAKIHLGAAAGAKFAHVPVREGDELRIGSVRLRFLETPGHTPESVSVLVFETADAPAPAAVLTGDTLFIGDVGRPDLLGAVRSARDLAGDLYDSLHGKLLSLPDAVRVYPAHGAGSMCGRNISSETSSTIGEQRRFNYALQPMPREDFIAMMTTDLPEAPAYFGRDAAINRDGPALLEELPAAHPLSVSEVADLQRRDAVILDTRSSLEYGAGHIPGSFHVGLSGQFASWSGTVLPPDAPIVLVAEDPDRAAEARRRLSRVGLDRVAGYLDGGIRNWSDAGRPLARTEQINVEELARRLREGEPPRLVDVRRPAEFEAGHIPGAVPLPLNGLARGAVGLGPPGPVMTICGGGYRSSIASSLLERLGYASLTNVVGGMAAWTQARLETVPGDRVAAT